LSATTTTSPVEPPLLTAAELAHRLQASLHVVHALPPGIPAGADAAGAGMAIGYALPLDDADSEQLQAAAEAVRQRAADVLVDAPLSWSWAATVGRTADLLEQQADAVGAYLVVVGLPHGGLGAAVDHLLTGSDIAELRRHASRPLLLVPPPP
jgi:nucleotide-binding universal stress UspA family protein